VNRPPEQSKECEVIGQDLTEFAIGTLSGRSRSLVLDHLETCAQCRAESESLAAVADTILWLAPEAEPPLGFESRLVERFRDGDGRSAMTRRRRMGVLSVAALLVAVLGFGVGAVTMTHGNANQPSATARPVTGQLTSNGQTLGQVIISSGSPSWMIMTVNEAKWSGVVWCEVSLANGRIETIGTFTLANGYGSWIAPIKAAESDVRSARLVGANGAVIASATFVD
jgi:hypothetical protein